MINQAAQALGLLDSFQVDAPRQSGFAGRGSGGDARLEAAMRDEMTGGLLERIFMDSDNSLMSEGQFDQRMETQNAADSLAGQNQAQALSQVLTAGGMDPRSVPGIGQALAGEQGANVANQLMGNPQFNPALAETMQIAATDREQAIQAAQQVENQRIGGITAAMNASGQDVGVVQDMKTLYDTVGSETFPTAAKGAFAGLRFRALNAIARTTEAGALQQAEIELFNSILPEGTEWTSFGRAEKMARLNQLEYWFKQKADNTATATGENIKAGDYYNYGREYHDILGPVPEGSVAGAGEYQGGNVNTAEELTGVGTIPGTNIPLVGPGGPALTR
jgi:hypothetical protein